jgi:hypothetical protein
VYTCARNTVSLHRFQVCSMVLLSVVTVLCIASPEIIHPVQEDYVLWPIAPILSTTTTKVYIYIYILVALEFEFRVLHMLRQIIYTWAMLPALFCSSYFSDRVSSFAWGWPQIKVLFLITCSWDHRCIPPCLAYWLSGGRGGVSLIFSQASLKPQSFWSIPPK